MAYVALLRGINVGGTGMLAMVDLAALCAGVGLQNVRTYIQSGNVVFDSAQDEGLIKQALENTLAARMGKPVAVQVRAGGALRDLVRANPFPGAQPAQIGIVFLDAVPPAGVIAAVAAPTGEVLHLMTREIFIHYPAGMGRSKLKLPPAIAAGTIRNLNTVAKLAAMAGA